MRAVEDTTEIEVDVGKAVLAGDDHALHQRLQGGTHQRHGQAIDLHPQERVRLLEARGENAARTVIFETSRDDTDAVGQQRRGKRIADVTDQRAAIERERQRARTVEQTALRHAMGSRAAHDRLPSLVRTSSRLRFTRRRRLQTAEVSRRP